MIINGKPLSNGRIVRSDYAHELGGHLEPRPGRGWYGKVKGALDVSMALAMFVVAAPVMLLACLAVKLTSRGPALYCQTRMGRGGKPYRIYKIRTMTHNCERQSGACWAQPNDPRITGIGRFLRRLHVDELPQLWNVIRGDMSLVGPRPERPEFLSELVRLIPRYRERLFVRPGLTGLAQVQLPPDTDVESVRRKLAYDIYYVEQMSFWLDCRLLFCTVLYVVGVSVSLRRQLLGIPHGKPVEKVFDQAVTQPSPVPELNPA